MNNTILYIILGYLAILLIVYIVQEKLIFKPEKLAADFIYKYDIPFKELFFEVKPGVSINGLHGIINLKGEYILPGEMEKIIKLTNELLKLEKDEKLAYYNINKQKFIWKEEEFWNQK